MPRRTALVVENDSHVAHRVERILEELGLSVVSMPDAESARMVFEYAAPDLVLVGYPIGSRAADDVPALVRASSRPTVPVLAMFPFSSRSLARQAISDGCVDVIPKPVDRLLLEDIVRHVLRGDPRPAPQPFDAARLVS